MDATHDWEAFYAADDLPWDADQPCQALVAAVERYGLAGRALEIGCGTGTQSRWLGSNGFDVVATDVSPTAVRRARERCAGLPVRIEVGDVLRAAPVADGSVDFAFDRGVLHVMDGDDRTVVVERIAAALVPGGLWLSLIGNADEVMEPGPPRWTAREVVSVIERCFTLESLEPFPLVARLGTLKFWRMVGRVRAPAAAS